MVNKQFEKFLRHAACLLILLSVLQIGTTEAARIKDVANIDGVSGVQVIGYGLVTGLNNTGDSPRSTFTIQSVTSMLKRFGITVPQTNLRTRNVAAVIVTAVIPPYLKPGARFDIQVSSLGDARSLQGGMLLMTPLSGSFNDNVYGMAQGAVSIGGYQFEASGSSVGKNFTAAGRVPGGGMLERETPRISDTTSVTIQLNQPDYTLASRVAEAIRDGGDIDGEVQAVDAGTVQVRFTTALDRDALTAAIARIEALEVQPDPAARVVINERTGTIVIGGAVTLQSAVVAHGSLEIQIQNQAGISQPRPFTFAENRRVDNATVTTTEQLNPASVLPATSSVQEMADALNALRVSPRDLIAIFQALKQSGALQAELVIQ